VLADREEKYSFANYAAVAVLFATAIVTVVHAASAQLAKASHALLRAAAPSSTQGSQSVRRQRLNLSLVLAVPID
jgi:hypothetical protein